MAPEGALDSAAERHR